MSKTASGVCCVVQTCRASKRKVPNLRLFKFPKNNELQLREWLRACGITDVSVIGLRKFLICHRHFNPDQVGDVYLKKNAIPELYLDSPPPQYVMKSSEKNLENTRNPNLNLQENAYEHKEKFSMVNRYINSKYRKSGRRCIIRSCRATYRSNPKLRFFSFPNPKSDRFQKWVKICKLTPTDMQLKNILICEKHFWKAELCGKRYTADAEPKFFLSAPRYKVIGPSDPNFKPNEQQKGINIASVKNELLNEKENNVINKCIIRSCQVTSNSFINMMTFPKEALNLFDVWSDIFKLDPAEVFNIDVNSIKENNNLYICKRHALPRNETNELFSQGDFSSENIKNEHIEMEIDINVDMCEPLKKKSEKPFEESMRKVDEFDVHKYYEDEIIKIKKEAEKEKIKHLSIISNLKEENFKLKDELSKFK